MLPFSFKEYVQAKNENDKEKMLADYMKNGSFPYISTIPDSGELTEEYIEGIYNTVVVKDIEERQNRKEKTGTKRKITDIALLKSIAKYLASVIGSPVSVKSITDYIVSGGRKVSQNTIDDYIDALTESFVFYPAERFDVNGKQLLTKRQILYS